MYQLDHNSKVLKTTQIVRFITKDIELKVLQKGDRLTSINDFSRKYGLARDTVERAYKELVEKGLIESVPGKGFYVKGKRNVQIKILLIFNKLSYYKKIVYDSMIKALGNKAWVDLQIYHYNPDILKRIIDENYGKYHFYVVMPHFFHDADMKGCLSIINKIPPNQLVLLDKKMEEIGDQHISVYQDFEQDIYQVLNKSIKSINKYEAIALIFPKHSHHPVEVINGVKKFCKEQSRKFIVSETVKDKILTPQTLYVVLTEDDLALLLKKAKAAGYTPGKEIGVISFNETPLKELLNITVVSTDFEEMGKKAAELILKKEYKTVHNPFFMIPRGSL